MLEKQLQKRISIVSAICGVIALILAVLQAVFYSDNAVFMFVISLIIAFLVGCCIMGSIISIVFQRMIQKQSNDMITYQKNNNVQKHNHR